MEDRRDPMNKLVEAVYEYADDRIEEVQDLYRRRAEGLVEKINQCREWAKDGMKADAEREEWAWAIDRMLGIEEALTTLGFKVVFDPDKGESYLA